MVVQVIKKPIITERSVSAASKDNTYTFLVARTARKKQIAEAIAELFKVEVEKVRTVTVPIKRKKTGKRRMMITKALSKKALVTLKTGQTIDLFDIGGQA